MPQLALRITTTSGTDLEHVWSRVRSGSPIGLPRISRIGLRWRHRSRTCGPIWTSSAQKLHDLLRTPPGVRHARAGLGMANMYKSVRARVAQPGESRSREQVRMSRYINSDLCFERRFGRQHQYVCLPRVVFVPYKFRPVRFCCSMVSFQ